MVLRGILARRLVSATILVLTAVVVAGTVAAVGFARLAEVSRGAAGMLVLLGLVAIAAQSAESVRRREPEIALARLRGRRGARLLVFAVAEPGVVVILGAAAGLVGGWLLGRAVVGAWLPAGTAFSVDRTVLEAAAAVTLGALLIVGATTWRVLRSPLLAQLAAARRPRRTTTTTLFLQVVLVLGAVVAVYQAHQADRSRVDWVTLLSPALVGLAAGQILMWLLTAALSIVVPRRPDDAVGWFLTLRRLLRRADSLALLRTVVAAGVVAAVAASAFTLAQSWRDHRARLQVGAPLSYAAPGGALRAYAAAHTADPQGRWLLPVAYVTAGQRGGARRVLVDSARWNSVVGDFFASTDGDLGDAIALLDAHRTVAYSPADELSAVVDAGGIAPGRPLEVSVQYVNDNGDLQIVALALTADGGTPTPSGGSRFAVPVRGCTAACSVAQVNVSVEQRKLVLLQSVTFGGRQLLAPSAGAVIAPAPTALRVRRAGNGLLVAAAPGGIDATDVLASFRDPAPQRSVATSTTRLLSDNGIRSVMGVDGQPRRARVVAQVEALPFAGTEGVAADLPAMLAGAGGNIVAAEAAVLARADTPTEVLAALQSTGAVRAPTTYAGTLSRLAHEPRAEGTRLYALIAVLSSLVALVSIAASVAQQLRERRAEAASLRSIGVPAPAILGAYRREALLLAGTALVGTAVAGWISCWVLLRALPLVSGWAFAPALEGPSITIVGGVALAAAVLVAGTTYGALRGVGRGSPPRLLREDAT